jgi:hypothetical protein
MSKFVLTVVTSGRGKNHFHAEHETEEAAKTEQAALLAGMAVRSLPDFGSVIQYRTVTRKPRRPEHGLPHGFL